MAQVDIYFYSERCEWCRKANSLIEQIGPKRFLFVNAMAPTHPLPPFVDRVPMILTQEKRVVADDDLFTYLNAKLDIAPFMVKEMAGLSDSYSYISTESPNGATGGEAQLRLPRRGREADHHPHQGRGLRTDRELRKICFRT